MKLNIKLEDFEGPFDLLLKLIDREKIDIYDVKIEEITNPFLEEMAKMDIDISMLSEFIYTSSILLTIKANKLLPKAENENLEEDFLSYLIEYKKIKSVQDDFKTLEEEARKIHSKYQEDLSAFQSETLVISQDVDILSQEFSKLIKRLEKEKQSEEKIFEQVKIPDVNTYLMSLRKTLNFSKELNLVDITRRINSKAECIATFLALLEMVKLNEIYIKQTEINSFKIVKRVK
ncbi:ScpA family protein [Anaerococcus murdochii]|uniref:Segregation and condensation protein A n=1 Tax=Anaerococcus murdochii TaxID=411577 RepID=A0ABS7T128_9FIRM|nr:segregation/condensation protein A [Anaerococcus murdochii]MBZ2387495.1 segregation/condensation protein A [Anaerococcus murdochii]